MDLFMTYSNIPYKNALQIIIDNDLKENKFILPPFLTHFV